MVLNREKGGYYLGAVMRFGGSFRIDSTNNPDVVRDGNSNCIESVVRESAGLFTVTFLGGQQAFPLPSKLTSWKVDLAQGVAPSQACKAHYVVDSYSAVTRTFQIQCWDFETPSAVDPDDNDMIAFELVGCLDTAGTDAA